MGWVSDFDDDNKQFLVLFSNEPPNYIPPKTVDEPFLLTTKPNRKAAIVMARRGQQRFRFQVMAQYGSKCAVCNIQYPALLKAAHICGVAQQGSDDWRTASHFVRPTTMLLMATFFASIQNQKCSNASRGLHPAKSDSVRRV
jgi:hypothetical protein